MDTQSNGMQSTIGTRRRRSSKKRLKFGPPQHFPRGVKELWTSASKEEQERAHQACTQILSLWLGKRAKRDVAESLSIPPLRVWQLSQQALSGMLAGLLHQPRPRRRHQEETMEQHEDDPRRLKKRIADQERQIADQQELIRLLTSIPKPHEKSSASTEAPTRETKTRGRRAAGKREDGRGEVSVEPSSAIR